MLQASSMSDSAAREFFDHHIRQLAPTPMLWLSTVADLVCSPLGCGEWRQFLSQEMAESIPKGPETICQRLPTYPEFLESTGQSFSMSTLYQFAFQTPTTSLALLTSRESLITLVILVMILRTIKSQLLPYFSSIGRHAGRRTHGVEWEKKNEIRIHKFGEYVFRLCFHTAISFVGIVCFRDAPWWTTTGTVHLWIDWPNQVISTTMIWYYLIQSAYNIDAMSSLLEMSLEIKKSSGVLPYKLGWSKDVRGDFQEMFIHHVVTNLLIFGSSAIQMQRIGSMVFIIHDVSDVPVDLSKLANFMKWKVTTVVCFVSMVLVWCVTRLGALPFLALRSSVIESWTVVGDNVDLVYFYKTFLPIFWILLGMLVFLHLVWFTMFIQMGYVLVAKGEAHDLSEHKTGEEQLSPLQEEQQQQQIKKSQ